MNARVIHAAAIVLVVAQASRADSLYVTESNGTVVRYDTSSPTTAPTTVISGLTNPANLTFDASGNLFIAVQTGSPGSIQQDTILKYTPDGTLTTFANGLHSIQGLGTDVNDNLYASSQGTNSILKFTPGGSESTFASNLVGPTGLTVGADGNVYVSINANLNQVVKITPDGTESTYATGFFDPLGLAFDRSGDLYVANPGFFEIVKLKPGGAFDTNFTTDGGVKGVAVDSAGDVFFTDGNDTSGIIGEITPDGTISTFATTSSGPEYLAFAPAAVPEPSSLFLMAAGLAAVVVAAHWAGLGERRKVGRRSERGQSPADTATHALA